MLNRRSNTLAIAGTMTRAKPQNPSKVVVDHFLDLDRLNDSHIEDRLDYNSWIGCNSRIPGFGRLPEVF